MPRGLRWKRVQQARRRGAYKAKRPAETTGGAVKIYQASPEELARLLEKGARAP